MSPEQIQGGVGKDGRGELDGRSDLYSTGVLLYQLLTGALPFSVKSKMEVLVAHLYQKPRPMREANPEGRGPPPQVERLVMSCLERDPDLRPPDARELAERFRAAMRRTAHGRVLNPDRLGSGPWAPRRHPRCRRPADGRRTGSGLRAPRPGPGPIPTGSGTAGPDRPTPPAGAHRDRRESREGRPLGGISGLRAAHGQGSGVPRPGQGRGVRAGKTGRRSGGRTAGLKHKADRVIYYGFAPGSTCPWDISPRDPDDILSSWPKALVRQSDKVRFIRITGGRYTAGILCHYPRRRCPGESDPHPRGRTVRLLYPGDGGHQWEIKEYQAKFPDEPSWRSGRPPATSSPR